PAAKSSPVVAANSPPRVANWSVQLVGDRSELKAIAAYSQLQKKHQGILGAYTPDVVRTTPRPGATSIWSRVRIVAASRELADSLCSKLRAAGESCLVQRD